MQTELVSTVIRQRIGSGAAVVDTAEIGEVLSVGDGIARVNGVERAMLGRERTHCSKPGRPS